MSVYAQRSLIQMMGEAKNMPKDLHIITKNWDPKTAKWNTPWTKPGGDFEQTPLASCNNNQLKKWEEFDVTQAIKDFLTGELKQNHGFMVIFKTKDPGKAVQYKAAKNVNQTFRPKLTITYKDQTPIKKITNSLLKRGVTVQVCNRHITINSGNIPIKNVTLYDLSGKIVLAKNPIKPNTKSIVLQVPTRMKVILSVINYGTTKSIHRIVLR